MKEVVFSSPFFGISISIFAFAIGTVINKKTKIALLNPLLISYVIIIAFMVIFDILHQVWILYDLVAGIIFDTAF